MKMRLTRHELRLAQAGAAVVWWMEATGTDLEGLLSGDRQSLDELRAALAVYVKNRIIKPLAERRPPERQPGGTLMAGGSG